jgi:prevent-host-death family protein
MAITVGAYEARTRFGELLEKARQGQTVAITRRGQLIAELGPAGAARAAESRAAAEAAFNRLRRDRVRFGEEAGGISAAIRGGRL